ncbi:aKG-HExxH-type peptide beta-hydroxylase [Streptomyces sp. NBC_00334]|uniref:aKG-HExxH-type peptide beta-hydroxylase n=1 Tax=Streptomyces sp. NBC_00334 TaxID=2975713 RepID=UPI002E2B1785|nr:HEXXH motif-containing putative peptide modification protein [Streptomyces sp. NBC_00334]
MTSEPRPAPFRVPDRLFAELAAGGGSAEAVVFLERGERARRLLLLRTLLDRLAELPTPLTPVADVWEVFKDAAAQNPEGVDGLLLAPTTGAWIAHMLRRVHGTATGPPLWAEAGRLNVLALTAAVRAGTETVLTVPLTGRGLHLPGLGLLRLPSAPGPSVARATTRSGELTVSGPPARGRSLRPVTCRPVSVPVGGPDTGGPGSGSGAEALARSGRPGPNPGGEPEAATGSAATDGSGAEGVSAGERRLDGPADARHAVPHASTSVGTGAWLPLRTLTHTTPTGPVAIPLEDLDPYRDLDDPVPPARLDAEEAAEWQRVFDGAVAVLAATGTDQGPGRLDPALIRAVVPYGRTAATPPAAPAVAVSASSGDAFGAMVISRPGSALALAETLVHEFQHSKLAALLHLFPLLDDDREERYYAPWRADPRHLTGLLHGAYAFTGVAGFWRDRLAEPAYAEAAAYHFALRRLQCRLVVRTLLTSTRLTAPGRRLVEGLARTLDGWLRVPVDPVALRRARTAAALHRAQWRLRNVATPPAPDGTLRFRPDRGFWPDTRTHVFAVRPAVPRTADEYLAVGDPATALNGYAEDLARDPADPHALSGWIVARAALDPGHATRRLLARPELHRPRPGG